MYLKVLQGKINYKDKIYCTGDMFECRKEIGVKLINSNLCAEIHEDIYKVMTKHNNSIDNTEYVDVEENKEDEEITTIDDLRDSLR